MLLTLSKPAKSEFEFKTHDYSPTFSSHSSVRYSPKLLHGGLPPSQPASSSSAMGTPHRGLPPPSAMTLPEPGRAPPPIPPPMGSLPPAPSQWQGSEDGMKNWLAAKAEEEKRKQEEEKTRQESLKLEQRKIEQTMLRESMQGGIPPHLVPMIFAGIGGGNLANISAEWIQQYTAQLQSAQQQQAQSQSQSQLSPDLRRETRLIGQNPPPGGVYAGQPQTPQTAVLPPTSVLPGQPVPSSTQSAPFSASPYGSGNMSPRARAAQSSGHVGAPTSAPRPPPQSQLPRLTTNEIHIQQPPTAPANVQLQQTQTAQQEASSPSIYFHHWVPPTSQQEKTSSGNPPATPSDYTSSPKKRKAQGQHAAPPPPTSAPQSYTSPSFSHVSTSSASTPGRRGHTRARSDASTRGHEGHSAPVSRRGTLSSHAHEPVAQPSEVSEQRFQYQFRGAEGQPQHPPQYDRTYPPSPPQRGIEQQHAQAATQADTRQSAPYQQGDQGPMSSPKREVGGQ